MNGEQNTIIKILNLFKGRRVHEPEMKSTENPLLLPSFLLPSFLLPSLLLFSLILQGDK